MQIYFRIHVSVLKLLFSKYPDVDVNVLEEHLQRALQGPFHHPEFDSDTGPGTVYRTESTTSGLLSLPYIHLRSGWKNITVLSSLRRVERERERESANHISSSSIVPTFSSPFSSCLFFRVAWEEAKVCCSFSFYSLFTDPLFSLQKSSSACAKVKMAGYLLKVTAIFSY